MGKLLRSIFGWLIEKARLFVVMIVVLIFAPYVVKFVGFVRNSDPTAVVSNLINQGKDLALSKRTTKEEIDRKLNELSGRLAQKNNERKQLNKAVCILPTCTLINSVTLYKVEMEIDFLTQAQTYGTAVKSGAKVCGDLSKNQMQLNNLRQLDGLLNASKPWWSFPSPSHESIKDQIRQLQAIIPVLAKGCTASKKLQDIFEFKQNPAVNEKFEKFLLEFEALKKAPSIAMAAVREVLPTAIFVLLGIFLMPLTASVIWYYVIAPFLSRGSGIQIFPEASGEFSIPNPSATLQQIEVETGWELLVDAELIRAVPTTVSIKLKWLLDNAFPLSSIASGLYQLSCVRSNNNEPVTIAAPASNAGPGAASQIAILDLPEGSALVLQPRCLVGVIQPINRPVRITTHWRIGNLSSWLTLQLRYVVFHGPVKLIMKGNRGVRIDLVQAETSLKQAHTLGFSANLHYAVCRCDIFYDYLIGKTELFNDRFSSGKGFYIQETSPAPGGQRAFPNPLIILINVILNALGLQ